MPENTNVPKLTAACPVCDMRVAAMNPIEALAYGLAIGRLRQMRHLDHTAAIMARKSVQS